METVAGLIMLLGIAVSILALIVALESYRKERGYWRENEAMMKGWLDSRDRRLEILGKTLLDTKAAHREVMDVGNKNYVKMNRQIASLKGRITKLNKRVKK